MITNINEFKNHINKNNINENAVSIYSMLGELSSFITIDKEDMEKAQTPENLKKTTNSNNEVRNLVADWSAGVYDEDPGQLAREFISLLENKTINENRDRRLGIDWTGFRDWGKEFRKEHRKYISHITYDMAKDYFQSKIDAYTKELEKNLVMEPEMIKRENALKEHFGDQLVELTKLADFGNGRIKAYPNLYIEFKEPFLSRFSEGSFDEQLKIINDKYGFKLRATSENAGHWDHTNNAHKNDGYQSFIIVDTH